MNDRLISRDELLAELQQLRRRVTELEDWKTQHEWVLDAHSQDETKFKKLAENSGVGVYLIQDGMFKYVNPKLAEMFGYTVEELLTTPNIMLIVHADDRPAVLERLRQRISGEAIFASYQFRVVTKSGEISDVRVYGSRMEHNGTPAVIGTALDVTGQTRAEVLLEQKVKERTAELFDANEQLKQEAAVRRKAEDRLRQSESMLRDILSTSPVGIGLTEDRTMKWANEAWMRMFGFGNEHEFAGKSASIVYPSYEEYKRVGSILYEGLETGRVTSTDATFKRTNGSLFEGHIRMKALRPPDAVKGAIAVIADISHRKRAEEALRESEERYRAVFNNAGVGIALTDTKGRWHQVNSVCAEMFGRTGEELRSLTNLDITYADDMDISRERFHSLVQGDIDSYRYQKRFVRKDGSPFWTDVSVSAIRGPDGSCQATVGVLVDITDNKEAQRALQESQQRLELALDGADLGLWDWNIETGEVFCNQRWAEMVGVSADDKGLNIGLWNRKVHPDDLRSATHALKSHLAGIRPHYEIEYRLRNREEGWTWIHARGKVVERNDEGKPLRMTGTSLDITDRKRSEEALKQSENKFRLLYENAPVGYQSLDEQGNLVEVNAAWVDLMGYSREEAIGTWFGNYLATSLDERFREHFRRLKETGSARGIEYEMVKKDGSIITVTMDGAFVRDEHGVDRSHCVLHDVTSRRKAEKVQRRLATAVEQVSEGIVITDSGGIIQYVNPAFEGMTGYACEEVLGRKTAELWSSTHADEFIAELRSKLEQGEVWSGRVKERKKDGTVYLEDTTISPVFGDSGEIINFVGVKRDVTEQIALEKQLLHAQKMEAVGTLAGGIAHDFNNLLTVVSGYAELLLMGRSHDDSEYQDLRKISLASQRGSELVRSLLAFSRKVETKPRPTNLNHSVDQTRKLLYRTIPKMIELELDLAEDIRIVNADPAQMEQVLINLAVNAKDAMPDGGKLIIETANVTLDTDYCKTHLIARPGDYVQITVSDTGQGMEKETLEHIFEPFYTTKDQGQGTGLGLAMVYGIVEQHKGHITCYSEQGVGTTFKILIPAIETEEETDVATSTEMPACGTETILLVDDEQFVRDLGVRILNLGGYTVLTAGAGREALDVYTSNKEKISLVIMDLIMRAWVAYSACKNF